MYNRIKEKISLFWLLHICGWGLYFAFDYIAFMLEIKKVVFYNISNVRFFFFYLSGYFTAFLLTIALRNIYRRIDFQSMSLSFILGKIFIFSLIAAQIVIIVSEFVNNYFIFYGSFSLEYFVKHNLTNLFRWTIPLLGWSMLYFSIKFLLAWRVQKEKTETKALMAENTQVEMLRYQIDQDFLFGSLGNIKKLVSVDKENAKTIINDLSEYLRYILLSSKVDDVPLNNEMEAVKHYLDIENKRYGGRLSYDLKTDTSVAESPVMSLLILQIVRILIKRLFDSGNEQLKFTLTAEKKEDKLNISSTITIPSGDLNMLGMGDVESEFKEIKDRLLNRYSDHHELLISSDEGRLKASLSLW